MESAAREPTLQDQPAHQSPGRAKNNVPGAPAGENAVDQQDKWTSHDQATDKRAGLRANEGKVIEEHAPTGNHHDHLGGRNAAPDADQRDNDDGEERHRQQS